MNAVAIFHDIFSDRMPGEKCARHTITPEPKYFAKLDAEEESIFKVVTKKWRIQTQIRQQEP
jgi:hypothetical protein